jgi:hypothetical protein
MGFIFLVVAGLKENYCKLTLKSQQEIGLVFIKLIDEALEHHATWRDSRDARPYFIWAMDFKARVSQAISDWFPKVGYAAGNLLVAPVPWMAYTIPLLC